jgi:hypothetical protein
MLYKRIYALRYAPHYALRYAPRYALHYAPHLCAALCAAQGPCFDTGRRPRSPDPQQKSRPLHSKLCLEAACGQ